MKKYLLYCLLLASCKGSEVASVKKTPESIQKALGCDKQTADSLSRPSAGLASYQKQVEAADKLKPVPPEPPVNPTKAELKAYEKRLSIYERELKEWRRVQVAQAKAYAKANRAPLFQGKGAQNAPNAAGSVQNSYKPEGSAQATDSSTVQQAGGNAANIPGNGNTTTQTKQDTTKEAPGVLATIADNLTGPLGIVLALVVAAGIGFGAVKVWALVFRDKSTDPTV